MRKTRKKNKNTHLLHGKQRERCKYKAHIGIMNIRRSHYRNCLGIYPTWNSQSGQAIVAWQSGKFPFPRSFSNYISKSVLHYLSSSMSWKKQQSVRVLYPVFTNIILKLTSSDLMLFTSPTFSRTFKFRIVLERRCMLMNWRTCMKCNVAFASYDYCLSIWKEKIPKSGKVDWSTLFFIIFVNSLYFYPVSLSR